jgi:2-polyprenyl-6-methoxyphenol hydroxylase-like FAD-dependent oxidoreductase
LNLTGTNLLNSLSKTKQTTKKKKFRASWLRHYASTGKVTAHPVWEFAADTVVRSRVVIIGDAAHTASPRTVGGCTS